MICILGLSKNVPGWRRCELGKIDTVTKDYMKKNTVFADACNYFIYGGRQIIDPEKLQELDTTEVAVPFGNGDEDFDLHVWPTTGST